MAMRVRRRFAAVAAVLAASTGMAAAADISVPLDEARIVLFDQPVSTVYVGNPMIADVSIIDSTRVFVLGRAFGATNLIALDAEGNQVSDDHVTVFGTGARSVTLYRGPEQLTYACTGQRCEASPLPGDAPAAFSAVLGQVDQRQALGLKAAQGTGN